MRSTVFGAGGFIGGHLCEYLRGEDHEVRAIVRGDESWRDGQLGHCFYAIGLTGDFRAAPFQTAEAHAGYVAEVLQKAQFTSFTYLSSTRIYGTQRSTREEAVIAVLPGDPGQLYNISKLMGEALCHATGNPAVRVARLSNVYGPGNTSPNFLDSIVRDAVIHGNIRLRSALNSEKDYVAVEDVCAALVAIAVDGGAPVTNVARGRNVSHRALVTRLAQLTGCGVEVDDAAPLQRAAVIDNGRLQRLCPPRRDLLDDLGCLSLAGSGRQPSVRRAARAGATAGPPPAPRR